MRTPTSFTALKTISLRSYIGSAVGERFNQVSQVFVNLAWPVAPPPGETLQDRRWRLAASVAATLFGGGMSSPFTDTVRERLGLAYLAHATTDAGDAWYHFRWRRVAAALC